MKRASDLSVSIRQGRYERIRRVVDGGPLTILFQPIAELASGRVVGVEALARFPIEPKRGPREWFAEAEMVGLLTDLELAATGRALGQIEWLPAGAYLSVNVSIETAGSRSLLEMIDGHAERIVLEVPARSLAGTLDSSRESLTALRDRGVRLAIDDAGWEATPADGELATLRPEFLKLGFGVTRRIHTDGDCRSRAAGVVATASEIDATVVAVGIEQRPELDALVALGVPQGQGFLLALPGYLPLAPAGEPVMLWKRGSERR